MTRRRPRRFTPRAHALAACIGLPLVALAPASALSDPAARPLLINETPSLPRGLWLRSPGAPARGAVVTIAQPAQVRPYLAALGAPPDLPLLKRVAAVEGDAVCSDGRALIAPGRIERVSVHDRRGVALPRWRGCRRLDRGELLLLGDTAASFDSRYFGPVHARTVTGVWRPLWIGGQR